MRDAIVRLLRRTWFPAAIVFLYVYSFPYYTEIHSANELPRIYLTMAMVDRHSFNIDAELRRYFDTPDTSTYKGKRYSNKPPGMSLLTVPAYVVQRWASGGRPPELKRMFFWFRLSGATIPSLLFLLLLWRFLRRLVDDETTRRLVLAGYALGTLALTYGTLLFSHQVSSALVATSFILIFFYKRGESPPWHLCLAGLAAAGGVLTDYQVAFIGPPLLVYLGWASRARARLASTSADASAPGRPRASWLATYVKPAALFGAGGVLPITALLLYHWACFDSPLRTGYDFPTDPVFRLWHSQGFLGLSTFQSAALVDRYFSADDGLFWYSPFLLLAAPGLALMLRRRDLRAEGIFCLVIIGFFVYFAASLAFISGWDVGPRYITCAVPYYLVAVAVFTATTARRWWGRALCGALIGVSILIYVTVNGVFPHFPDNFSNPWFDVTLRFGRAGYLPYNLGWLLGLRGLASAVPYLVVAAGLLLALLLGGEARLLRRLAIASGAVALAFCLLLLYHHQLSHRRQPVPVGFIPWMERIWEPRHPKMDLRRLLPVGDVRAGSRRERGGARR